MLRPQVPVSFGFTIVRVIRLIKIYKIYYLIQKRRNLFALLPCLHKKNLTIVIIYTVADFTIMHCRDSPVPFVCEFIAISGHYDASIAKNIKIIRPASARHMQSTDLSASHCRDLRVPIDTK